jgi:hypothetical protein
MRSPWGRNIEQHEQEWQRITATKFTPAEARALRSLGPLLLDRIRSSAEDAARFAAKPVQAVLDWDVCEDAPLRRKLELLAASVAVAPKLPEGVRATAIKVR